jgi:hypothetical protein
MKGGLYYLGYDSGTLTCRLVVGDTAIYDVTLLDFIAGHASPPAIVQGVIDGYVSQLQRDIYSAVSGAGTVNIEAALNYYYSGLQVGQQIPFFSSIIAGGETEFFTVSNRMLFVSATAKPRRFKILESGVYRAKLLEVTCMEVTFQDYTKPIRPFNVPLGYIAEHITGDRDFYIVAPEDGNWQGNTGIFVVSYFLKTPQTSAFASLCLNFGSMFTAPELPDWHFLLSEGKPYSVWVEYDSVWGYLVYVGNDYGVDDTPQDCVPFFSSEYPPSVSPFLRSFGATFNQVYFGFGRGLGGLPTLSTPINDGVVTVVPGDSILAGERLGGISCLPGVVSVSLLRVLGGVRYA